MWKRMGPLLRGSANLKFERKLKWGKRGLQRETGWKEIVRNSVKMLVSCGKLKSKRKRNKWYLRNLKLLLGSAT